MPRKILYRPVMNCLCHNGLFLSMWEECFVTQNKDGKENHESTLKHFLTIWDSYNKNESERMNV